MMCESDPWERVEAVRCLKVSWQSDGDIQILLLNGGECVILPKTEDGVAPTLGFHTLSHFVLPSSDRNGIVPPTQVNCSATDIRG